MHKSLAATGLLLFSHYLSVGGDLVGTYQHQIKAETFFLLSNTLSPEELSEYLSSSEESKKVQALVNGNIETILELIDVTGFIDGDVNTSGCKLRNASRNPQKMGSYSIQLSCTASEHLTHNFDTAYQFYPKKSKWDFVNLKYSNTNSCNENQLRNFDRKTLQNSIIINSVCHKIKTISETFEFELETNSKSEKITDKYHDNVRIIFTDSDSGEIIDPKSDNTGKSIIVTLLSSEGRILNTRPILLSKENDEILKDLQEALHYIEQEQGYKIELSRGEKLV